VVKNVELELVYEMFALDL